MATPIYTQGEQVPLHTDLFPAQISPRPPGVPSGVKLRAVVTARALTVMWPAAQGGVGRLDIPMTPEQTAGATYMGGSVGAYQLSRAGGCGCGARAVRSVQPFPGVAYVQQPREKLAPRQYGVPPARYTRTRSG
jgi:hypothetical protein